MKHTAKRSAASRRAWRTRKRMVQARRDAENSELSRILLEHPDERERLAWMRRELRKGQSTRKRMAQARQATPDWAKDPIASGFIDIDLLERYIAQQRAWPAYKKRALPNPWSKDLPPW